AIRGLQGMRVGREVGCIKRGAENSGLVESSDGTREHNSADYKSAAKDKAKSDEWRPLDSPKMEPRPEATIGLPAEKSRPRQQSLFDGDDPNLPSRPQTDSIGGAADPPKKLESKTDKSGKSEKPPATWKRDGKSPSFARVYIGDGNALELISINVTVTVDGPRARTLVDHIFHNPHARQLEGTFE